MIQRVPVFLILLVASLHNPAMGEDQGVNSVLFDEIEIKTLRPFFNALKSGNVRQVERYITGKKLKEAQLPKHEDKEYEKLLREYYKDAIFSVELISVSEDQVIVDVIIEFPGRGRKVTQFYLQQQDQKSEKGSLEQSAAGSRWRITEQRHEQAKTR